MIGVLYRKKSPHWGEYQFLSRLKSQVSLSQYYEDMVLGAGCGTPEMTKSSKFPDLAYQLGLSLK